MTSHKRSILVTVIESIDLCYAIKQGEFIMSNAMEIVDITPDLLQTILTTFNTDNERELTRKIIECYVENGFTVKVKQYNQPCMKGTYRILCFIKKSAEAVIINNKGMGRDGVSFQIRIDEIGIFERLNELSENIKKQILNATDCSYCSSKCEGKKYIFTYQGNEYTKCRFICNNFYFQNISNNDINDFMDIINNEILYNQTHIKKSKS